MDDYSSSSGGMEASRLPDVARVHITTNPASKCGIVELHSVLAQNVVQRSALLQGISESSGESSLPVEQSDIFGWLHVVTRRSDDVGELYGHGVLPDMSKPASVLSAADFVGDSKAYSQAVRELAATLFPSLHACLDGHATGPDEATGPTTSVRLALVRAFRAEQGMNPSAKVLLSLPPDVARQVLSQVPCSLLELLAALSPPLHTLAFLSRVSACNTLIAHDCANPRGPPAAGLHAVAALVPPLLLRGTQLRSLSLNNWALSAATATSLAAALPHLTTLHTLTLRHSLTAPSHIGILAPYLARMPALRHLDLTHACIDTIAAAAAAHHVSMLTSLTALDLSHNPLLTPTSPLPPALAALTRLVNLGLASTGIDAATLPHVLLSLASLSALQDLDLSGNSFGNHPRVEFGPSFDDLHPLQTLCMNNVRPGIAPDCMSLLATIDPTLTRLELSNYMPAPTLLGVDPLCACLLRLSELRVLDLSGNYWTVPALGVLRATLAALPVLRELSVMRREPEFASMGAADQVVGLPGLQRLAISGWLREAAATEETVAALAAMTELTSLCVSFGAHARSARAQLGNSFQALTQLRSLCVLAHEVCMHVLPHVAALTGLTCLEVVDTRLNVSQLTARSVWQCMAGMRSLVVIKMGIDGPCEASRWDVDLLAEFLLWHRRWPALRELHLVHCQPQLHNLVDGMFLRGVRLCKYVDHFSDSIDDV
eukprot:jgi/Ulvmu1/1478/UM011_0208.1